MSKDSAFYIRAKTSKCDYKMGQTIAAEKNEKIKIEVCFEKEVENDTIEIKIVNNYDNRMNIDLDNKSIEICVKENLKWIRCELVDKISGELLAKTNSIYFNII